MAIASVTPDAKEVERDAVDADPLWRHRELHRPVPQVDAVGDPADPDQWGQREQTTDGGGCG